MAPVNEKDYYEVLSSFPIERDNYEQKTVNPGKSHVTNCNYIKSHFDRDNDGNQFFFTCQKIAIFIEYLKSNDIIGDKNITCKYLNYLINSELKKFNYSLNETQEFYMRIIEEYEKQGYPLKTLCKGFIEHIDNDIFVKIRKLYNLYYGINKFINMSDSTRECKTLSDYVQLYTAYTVTCGEESQDAFCEALKKFPPYCNRYNSILMSCTKEWSSLYAYILKEYSLSDVVDGDEEAPVEGPKENDDPGPSTQRHMGAVGEHGLHGSSGFSEDIVDAPPDNDSDYNRSSKGTIISASSVGTFCALFLLYKFTPIRSMIDPRIRKTKKMLENPIQSSDELHPYEHNDYFTNADINRYNVGYQSR